MSVRAILWAFETNTGCPSDKLVLLVLANFASDQGEAYPRVGTIARNTMLHEETVSKALARLVAAGTIKDTGKTLGETGRVKVYQLPESTWEKDPLERSGNTRKNRGVSPPNTRLIPGQSPGFPGYSHINNREPGGEAQAAPPSLSKQSQEGPAAFNALEAGAKPLPERQAKPAPEVPPEPHLPPVVAAWNEMASRAGVRRALALTVDRARQLKARLAEPFFVANWQAAVDKVPACGFLVGRNDRGWKADLEFFLRPGTVASIMEGKYDDAKPQPTAPPRRKFNYGFENL